MSFALSSPLTGGAQTGLTSPTYTLTEDSPPNSHSEQYAVTALGGTQTGVDVHSVSSPFTITMERPAQFKQLGTPNPVTGRYSKVERNVFTIRVRKGVGIGTDQPKQTAMAEIKILVPAGADTEDAVNLRAMMSALIGALSDNSAGYGDTLINGLL